MNIYIAMAEELEKIALNRVEQAAANKEIGARELHRLGPAGGELYQQFQEPGLLERLKRRVAGTKKEQPHLVASRQHMWGPGESPLSAGLQGAHNRLQGLRGDNLLARLGGDNKSFPLMGAVTDNAGAVHVPRNVADMYRPLVDSSESPLSKVIAAGQVGARTVQGPVHTHPLMVHNPLEEVYRRIGSLRTAPVLDPASSDSAIYNAMVAHEGGEKAYWHASQMPAIDANLGFVPTRVMASHQGVLPVLEEKMQTFQDPEAQKYMARLRQMHPDDEFMERKIRQFGGTPQSPIAPGTKLHNKLEEIAATYNPMEMSSRRRRVQEAIKGTGHGITPTLLEKVMAGTIERAGQSATGGVLSRIEALRNIAPVLKGVSERIGQSANHPREFGDIANRLMRARHAVRI